MSNILDQIFTDKKKELPGTQRQSPLSEIKQRIGDQQPARDVFKALEKGDTSRIIAEIKPKTPFKGELRKGFDAKITVTSTTKYKIFEWTASGGFGVSPWSIPEYYTALC